MDFQFSIKFGGDYRTGAAAAAQFIVSLKLGPGKFKEQKALTPEGGKATFFVNPDKNGAQVRKEVQSKGLLDLMGPLKPDKKFFLRREAGVVFLDRKPLVSVVVVSESYSRLSWNHAKRIESNIAQEQVEEAFKAMVASGWVQWS